jgi:6-phosphogluconolactonase
MSKKGTAVPLWLLSISSVVLLTLAGCERLMPEQEEERGDTVLTVPLIIGTYTGSNDESGVPASEGVYRVVLEDAGFSTPELFVPVDNPSFIALDEANERLYLVSEGDVGQLLAYDVGGRTSLVNSAPTHGAYPCYVALSPNKQQIAVANYGAGNVAVYGIDQATGALVGPAQQRQHSGSGPNEQRQEGPHAHWVQWDPQGAFVYAVDLGIDRVIGYPVDQSGQLGEGFTAIETVPGAGPRHLVFHPDKQRVYIVTELDNTVVVAEKQQDGTFAQIQRVDTLPSDFHDHSQAAHIEITPDGNNLYVSNRGHNSITVFKVADDGRLQHLQFVSTEGDWPRHFVVLPEVDRLLVANQNSNNVVSFAIDDEGRLAYTGNEMTISQPVFVAPDLTKTPLP